MSYPPPDPYYGYGQPPPPSYGYPPPHQQSYYGQYPQQSPPQPAYSYGAPPPPQHHQGYGYPPPPAPSPYGGYSYPPAPSSYPPPPQSYASPSPSAPPLHAPPPPQPIAPREGELRPPPDVGVDPNSFRRFFSQELQKLSYNSKPVITSLTLFAHEHSVRMGVVVAQCLEEHLRNCPAVHLLPTFYLLDSISKNIGPPYLTLFSRFLERGFLSSYHSADPSTKTKLEELLGTWKTGGADGGELFRLPEEGREGRVQRGIETALWGSRGKGGLSGTTKETSGGYGNGVAQLPQAATTSERSGVLYDVRRLLGLRQEHSQKVPGDAVNEGQISALRKLESLILNTQLTTDQVNQIRAQLAALAPPVPAPTPTPVLLPTPTAAPIASVPSLSPVPVLPPSVPGSVPSPPAPVPPILPLASEPATTAANPLAGIDLSLLSQLSATGALANLFQNADSPAPPATAPAASVPPVKVEEIKPQLEEEKPKLDEQFDDAAGLWEGEVLRMGVGMGNAEIALQRPQAPNVLYTLLPLTCQQCGLRLFESRHGKRKMDQHLDWHFNYKRRIREGAGRTAGRGWFTKEEEWYSSSSATMESASASTALASAGASSLSSTTLAAPNGVDRAALMKEKVPVPPAGSQEGLGDKPCPICQDRFKSEWSDEEEEWVWWNARVIEGVLYHATCHAEASLSRVNNASSATSASLNATRETTPAAASLGTKKRTADALISPVKPDLFRSASEDEDDSLALGSNGRPALDGEPELKRVKQEPDWEEDNGATSGMHMPLLEDGGAGP
ncbi:hypothetical protein JCM11641_001799 [Rhodosporidiobolus odoratus]